MDPTDDLEMGPKPPQVDAAESAPDENRSNVDQTAQSPLTDGTGSNNSNDQNDVNFDIFQIAKICVLDIDKTSDTECSYRETLHEDFDGFQEGLESPAYALGNNEAQQVLLIFFESALIQPEELRKCIKKYLRQRQVSQELIDQFLSWSPLRTSWLPPIGQRPPDSCFSSHWMRMETYKISEDEEKFIERHNSHESLAFLGPLLFPGIGGGIGSRIFNVAIRRRMDCLMLPQTMLLMFSGFEDEELQRSFIANVRSVNLLTGPGKLLHQILRLDLGRAILRDERAILSHLEEALRWIDFDLGYKRNHGKWPLWQSLLGFYRPHLHSNFALKRRVYRALKIIMKDPELVGDAQALKEDCAEFATQLEDVLRHLESTSNALIGSMSIMESSKAIKEAEEVTKLTQLAFFFIPLTFVAGIFGMNLKEMANVSIWIWVVTSAALLLASYFVLYFTEFWGPVLNWQANRKARRAALKREVYGSSR
ncbi:hypothetical protein IWZ01DRAFT_310466 [Phyllosticta capitalensis]